jgi:hypothetical protein
MLPYKPFLNINKINQDLFFIIWYPLKVLVAHVSGKNPLITFLNFFALSLVTRPNETFDGFLGVEVRIASYFSYKTSIPF